jgi:hypothetical protein
MVSRTKPLSVAIARDDGARAPAESLLARFLMRELESVDGINNLLSLLDAPQQILARRLAVHTANKAMTRFGLFRKDPVRSGTCDASHSRYATSR